MRLEHGPILEKKCNAIVLPSSAYVVYTGRIATAYFDDDISQQVLKKYPELGFKIASEIQKSGNYVYVMTSRNITHPHRTVPFINASPIPHYPKYHLINFPVKPRQICPGDGIDISPQYQKLKNTSKNPLPGYMATPQKGIIEESIKELEVLVQPTNWSKICIPAFKEPEINEMLNSILDDRYILITQ